MLREIFLPWVHIDRIADRDRHHGVVVCAHGRKLEILSRFGNSRGLLEQS